MLENQPEYHKVGRKRTGIRWLTILAALLFTLSAAGFTAYYVLKDRLLKILLNEANRMLAVKVETQAISMTWWSTFPNVALRFDSVTIHGAVPEHNKPLAKLRRLYIGFNALKLWRKQYDVELISLQNGEVYVYIDAQGNPNYLVTKNTNEQADSSAIQFAIRAIKIKDVHFHAELTPQQQYHHLYAQKATAAISTSEKVTHLELEVDGHLHQVKISKRKWLENKPLYVKTHLQIDDIGKKITFQPSRLKLSSASFEYAGFVDYGPSQALDFKLKALESDLSVLAAIVPNEAAEVIRQYKAVGKVQFDGRLIKKAGEKGMPHIDVRFSAANLNLTSPDGKAAIKESKFKGMFTNGNSRNMQTTMLKINDLYALFDGNPVEGNLELTNFDDPFLKLNFKGLLHLKTLLSFTAVQGIHDVAGSINADLNFEGKVNDLKERRTASRVKANGKFTLHNAGWRLANKEFGLSDLNGSFSILKKDLSIDKLSGRIGNSDLLLNGAFKNIVGYLLNDDTYFELDADLNSNYLNLEELLAVKNAYASDEPGKKDEEPYLLRVKPSWRIHLNCQVHSLRFERFRPKNVRGVLTLEDARAYIENAQMWLGGGRFSISSKLDLRNPELYTAWSKAQWENIPIDSVFYVTYNFNQNFLRHNNIKGRMRGNAAFELAFNERLDVFPDKVKADIDMTISEGELIGFEPVMQLSKFLKKADLANLRFEVLTNTFHIEDEMVIMPQMEVKSNAFEINVAGNHTFKQYMDYRLRIPLKNFRKADKDELFGEIKKDDSNDGNLYLIMKGYPDNIKITLDKEKVVSKIQERVQKEQKAIKEIIQNLKKKDDTRRREPEREPPKKNDEEPEYIEF